MTNKRLIRIDYATGKRQLLTPFGMAALDARWSPDGKQIVYIAQPDAGDLEGIQESNWEADYESRMQQQHLYIMDSDGRRQRRLTQAKGTYEENPVWSNRGQKLSFVRCKLTGNQSRSLWTIRPDGTELIRVRALPSE